jgi:tetratricopeptide (TPR) repeat protein
MHDFLERASILVIDDFQGMRTMLRNILKEMRVPKVDTVGSAKEALNLLRLNKYDVVLCDYNLGVGQNGQQLLEDARLSGYIGLSTIWMIVTAEKTGEMVLGAAEVKPDDYLLKPINQALLETRLAKLIAKKKSLGSIEAAIEARDYTRALALCDKRLQEQPLHQQELLRIKSDLLLTTGAYDKAKAVFDAVLAVRSVPWARTGLGKILFHTKQYDAAKDIFEKVLEENRMFMEASDWLAKTLDAMGEAEAAQQVLQGAVKMSPNSSSRQKALAEAAFKNGALDVAQAAFEKTIKISEHSEHKSPAVYAGLAKVFAEKDFTADAMRVLSQSKKEFQNKPEAMLHTAAAESLIYNKMGDATKAEAVMAEAEQVMQRLGGKIGTEVALEVAQTMFALGQKDKAADVLRDVVKNNHESEEISSQVKALFEKENMAAEGAALVKESQEEIININNQGVTLAKSGQVEEGARLLRQALDNLPNNEVIILNLCSLLLGQMRQTGKNAAMVAEVKNLLERVHDLNLANRKYHDYSAVLNRIMNAG